MSIQSKHFLDLIHSPTHEVRPAHFEIACMGADDQIRKALRFSQGDLEAAKDWRRRHWQRQRILHSRETWRPKKGRTFK